VKLQVGTFKWRAPPGYRSKFTGEQVNVLRNMFRRHLRLPHEFFCITDDPAGIDPDIRIIPLWEEFGDLKSPHDGRNGSVNPSCYRRLPIYGEKGRRLIGERFAVVDLDVCLVDDVTPIFDVPDDFKIWGDTAKGTPYNGSVQLMTACARRQVYETFDPVESPKRGRALGYIGSDQAWIAACLGPHEKKWTARDGVYSYRNEIAPRGGMLPRGARLVVFHGHVDPWQSTTQTRHRWVREHYR
jgi:hypothetical protein